MPEAGSWYVSQLEAKPSNTQGKIDIFAVSKKCFVQQAHVLQYPGRNQDATT
jgi:hypothetical protein